MISLVALRRLRFAGYDRQAEVASRTAIAALGVGAIAFQHDMDYDLRSRCLLIPDHPPRVEMVGRDGSAPEVVTVDRSTAVGLLERASREATRQGLGWDSADLRLCLLRSSLN